MEHEIKEGSKESDGEARQTSKGRLTEVGRDGRSWVNRHLVMSCHVYVLYSFSFYGTFCFTSTRWVLCTGQLLWICGTHDVASEEARDGDVVYSLVSMLATHQVVGTCSIPRRSQWFVAYGSCLSSAKDDRTKKGTATFFAASSASECVWKSCNLEKEFEEKYRHIYSLIGANSSNILWNKIPLFLILLAKLSLSVVLTLVVSVAFGNVLFSWLLMLLPHVIFLVALAAAPSCDSRFAGSK